MYLASFRQNNIVFTQNGRGFKKYQLRKKFIFRQIVTKITNFPILGEITYLREEKKKRAF